MNRRGFLTVILAAPVVAAAGKAIADDGLLPLCFGVHIERIEWPVYGPDYVPELFPPAPPRWDADGRDTHHPMYVTKEMVGAGFI